MHSPGQVRTSVWTMLRGRRIGAGTLYRHFPTRDSLLEAKARREVVVASRWTLVRDGQGNPSFPVEDGIVSICDACGGRIGILSTFKRGRGAEMMSTQFHLRAAS